MRSIDIYIHVCELLADSLCWRFKIQFLAQTPSAPWTPKLRHLSPLRRLPCRTPSPEMLSITPGDSVHHCIRHLSNDSIDDDMIMHLILYMHWFPCRGHQNRTQPDCSIHTWEAKLLTARGSLHRFVALCHYSGLTG